ncbi:MAG: AAA family ATPase [Dehalococcoidia bacterium]|nr:AAA family ATPase [Dehalococcoidia bacterium]
MLTDEHADRPLYVVGLESDAIEIREQERRALCTVTSEAIPGIEDWHALPADSSLVLVGSNQRHTERLAISARKAGLNPLVRNRISGMAVVFLEERTDADVAADLLGAAVPAVERKPRFRLIGRDGLDSIADPEWSLNGILPCDCLAMLFGDPGAGKSFVALDMAASVASGIEWHGHTTKGGDVLYVAAEGISGQKSRLAAWERANGLRVNRLTFVAGAVNFMMAEEITDLLADIAELHPVLIVVDTLARSMPGGDENHQRDMGLLIESAERLREATGACVLFVHHTNRAGSYRGSSALLGAVSTSIEVSKGGPREFKLECKKQKDSEEFPAMRFKLEPFGASLVPVLQGTLPRQIPESSQVLVDILKQAGRPLRNKEWREATDLPARTFNHHLRILKENRWVIAEGRLYRVPEVPTECNGTNAPGEDPVSAKSATPSKGGTLAPLLAPQEVGA